MKVLDIFGDTSKNWDKKLSEREDSDKDLKKSEEPNGNNNDSRDQYVDPELQRTMSYAKSQFPSYKDPQLAFDKWVQNNINRSEERDLEHDEEIENLYRKLNQVTTDLQRIKELQRTAKLGEERQRLDPKCWKGYRKVGTKIKGGVRVNDCKKIGEDQFEDKAAKVEAWGYMYNNQDRRIVWRKIFTSGEAAYRWADQRNATVLGTRETEDSNTEPRKPLFKESTVSIRRTTKMSTLGERKQQYQLLDALGRNIAVFESARRAQHIYTALTRLREALEVSNANPTDRVTMDIPLLLRVLEYAKEDAKTDMDLHDVTENLIDLSKSGQTLSMKDYESVVDVSDRTPEPTDDQINEVGDRYWCKNERRWKDRS
jgi:hypothetical protein